MSKCRYCGHPKEACACSEELGGMVFYKKDYVEGLEKEVAALKDEKESFTIVTRAMREKIEKMEAQVAVLKEEVATWKAEFDRVNETVLAVDAERDRLREALEDAQKLLSFGPFKSLEGAQYQLNAVSRCIIRALSGGEGEGPRAGLPHMCDECGYDKQDRGYTWDGPNRMLCMDCWNRKDEPREDGEGEGKASFAEAYAKNEYRRAVRRGEHDDGDDDEPREGGEAEGQDSTK